MGDKKDTYRVSSDQKPQVILANPVIDPNRFVNFPPRLSNHRVGFLDDPEKYGFQKTEVVFTKKGVEALQSGRTQKQFIALVQSHIGYVMDYVMEDVIRRAR